MAPTSRKRPKQSRTLQAVQAQLVDLRAKRKTTPKKVTIESLPEDQRPTQLAPLNKMLVDAVKMIAYRAETALVALLQPHLKKEDEARALVRELLVSSADIEPDDDAKTLTVRIHRMASPAHDKAIAALLRRPDKSGVSAPGNRRENDLRCWSNVPVANSGRIRKSEL